MSAAFLTPSLPKTPQMGSIQALATCQVLVVPAVTAGRSGTSLPKSYTSECRAARRPQGQTTQRYAASLESLGGQGTRAPLRTLASAASEDPPDRLPAETLAFTVVAVIVAVKITGVAATTGMV